VLVLWPRPCISATQRCFCRAWGRGHDARSVVHARASVESCDFDVQASVDAVAVLTKVLTGLGANCSLRLLLQCGQSSCSGRAVSSAAASQGAAFLWRWHSYFPVLASLRGIHAGTFVIFDVLAECAYDAFLASHGGLQFLIEAGKGAAVIGAEGVEHGFGEIRQSLQSELKLMLQVGVLGATLSHGLPGIRW